MVYVAILQPSLRELKVLNEILKHPLSGVTDGKDIDALHRLQKKVEIEYDRWAAHDFDFDKVD